MRTILGGLGRRIPRPTPAMGVALLALLIACSGVAVAAIPSSDGTITACRDNKNGTLRAIDTGKTCSARETQLAWKDGITGKVADSDKLDNKDSTDFYTAGSKVADSELLDGKDFSDFSAFGATEVIRGQGPLPLEGTFTSNGGTLIIWASGSGSRSSVGSHAAKTHGFIGMDVLLDSSIILDAVIYKNPIAGDQVVVSGADVFADEQDTHKAFVDSYTVVHLPEGSAGQHTIRLEDSYNTQFCNTLSERPTNLRITCTTTSDLDFFRVTVLEIPA